MQLPARLGGRTLFTPGGEVTEALKRLNARVVEVMSAMTRERDGIARAEKGDVDKGEKKKRRRKSKGARMSKSDATSSWT